MVNLILKETLHNDDIIKFEDLIDDKLSEESKDKLNKQKNEVSQLLDLINHFINNSLRIPAFENIFFGFKVDKIKCGDFDFIKVNEGNVINIEFKDITRDEKQSMDEYKKKLCTQLKDRKKLIIVFNRDIINIGFIQNG